MRPFQLSLHDIVPYMMQFANICKLSALTHALVTAGCIHHSFLGEIFSIYYYMHIHYLRLVISEHCANGLTRGVGRTFEVVRL